MALIACPECSKQVSDSAPACPNCGFAVADEMERRRQAAIFEQQKAAAAKLEARDKKKKKRKRITMLVVGAFLFLFCCVSSQVRSCQEKAAKEEAAEAKAKAEADRKAGLAAEEKALREKFASEVGGLNATLDKLEEAVRAENVEEARTYHQSLLNGLEPFERFQKRVPKKLQVIRDRLPQSESWLTLEEARSELNKESYAKALSLAEKAGKSSPELEGLDEVRDQAREGLADLKLEKAESLAKSKDWIEAEKNLKEAEQLLSEISQDRTSKASKRLARRVSRLMPRYTKRATKLREEAAAREAYRKQCGDAPQPDAWDGGLFYVESYVERSAHDPGSIDVENCGQPVLTEERCWRIQCAVLGKNAFGAQVRNVGTFWIASGQVVGAEM